MLAEDSAVAGSPMGSCAFIPQVVLSLASSANPSPDTGCQVAPQD